MDAPKDLSPSPHSARPMARRQTGAQRIAARPLLALWPPLVIRFSKGVALTIEA